MTTGKKVSIIFLWALNIINFLAGIITQFKMLLSKDINSIIPIKAELSVNQILMVNFMAVVVIMCLISIILTYLVCDVPYSPIEVLQNFSPLFAIPSGIVFILGLVNAFRVGAGDKLCIILCSLVFLIVSVIEISCVLTVQEDAE